MRRIIVACVILALAALVTAGVSVLVQPELLTGGPNGGPNWPALALVFGLSLAGVAGVTQAVVAIAGHSPASAAAAADAPARPRFDADHLGRQRAAMLDVVDRQWIQGRLARSLHNQAPLFLGLAEQPEAVRRPWDFAIQTADQPPRRAWDTGEIAAVFRQTCGLLILGAPGAGKTVTLLDLARQLIDDARRDPRAAMPVVFPLSSWAQARGPLGDWLVDELKRGYKVPPELGRWWVERFEILPLLDGLDEVDADAQAACVAAINAYREGAAGGAALVVCCRAEEYGRLKAQGAALELESAVTIQPLTDAQIAAYIGRLGEQSAPLAEMLAGDAALAALARAPLWLDVMSVAYAQAAGAAPPAPRGPADIFDDYIRRVLLGHRAPLAEFPAAQSLRWLRWLAQQLDRTNQTTLRLEAMQPDWLPSEGEQRRYKLSLGWVVGAIGGLLSVGLMVLLVNAAFDTVLAYVEAAGAPLWIAAFRLPVVVTSSLALTVWFAVALGRITASEADSEDHFIAAVTGDHWNWEKARRGARQSFSEGWGLAILMGLVAGSLAALRGRWLRVPFLALGMAAMLKLFAAAVSAVVEGLEPAHGISRATHPDDELRQTLRGGIIGTVVLGSFIALTLALSFGLAQGPTAGLLAGGLGFISFGFTGWCYTGGRTVLRHIFLRWQLWRLGFMPKPWRYVRFLQAMDGHMLLDRIGGAYKFKHDLLQRHIARLSDATIDSFGGTPIP